MGQAQHHGGARRDRRRHSRDLHRVCGVATPRSVHGAQVVPARGVPCGRDRRLRASPARSVPGSRPPSAYAHPRCVG